MEVYDVLGKFQLNLLSQEWVNSQWRQDFSSDKELPSDYAFALEDEDYGALLNGLADQLKEWLTTRDSSFNDTLSEAGSTSSAMSSRPDRKSWQTLLETDVNHKALIAVVSSFLKGDFKELTDDVTRRLALAASRAYFMLLSIKGSQVFNIYNAVLFYQAVESLKVLNLLGDVQDKPKPKGRGKKKKSSDELEEEPPEIDDTDAVHISQTERAELVRMLIKVSVDLEFCLSTLSLKGEEDALSSTITAMVSLVRLERTTVTFVERASKAPSVTYLAHRAYKTLMSLMDPRHGAVGEIVRVVCRSLLPHLVMSAQEMHTNDKTKSIIRTHMITFISLMIGEIGPPSYNGAQALLQQLCIKTPDKADIRARCVQQICTLLSFFPLELFTKCTLWICSLAHADAVRNRVVGIEILSKLLNSDEKSGEVESAPWRPSSPQPGPSRQVTSPRPGPSREMNSPQPGPSRETPIHSESSDEEVDKDDPPDPRPVERLPVTGGKATKLYVSHKLFLSALLSRAVDVSPTVRAKCLASFASLIFLRNQVIQDIMQSLFVSPYSHLRTPIAGIQEKDREDFDFRVFLSRKNRDAPSRNPLPGGSRIVYKIQALAKDQKVFVRKAALNVLCNICRLNPQWITQERLDIMVSSCLDFSVLVRKLMIQCLTELLLAYPTNELLIDAWVQGVFPLVSDNDVKCQEKAMEAVNLVVLDNLVAHNLIANHHHFLPWKIIKLLTVSEMRNIFRFMCRHWVISKRVGAKEMKCLRSYVGTESDLGAWYFIVCLSEFTDFHQPDMIVQYYLDHIYNQSVVREYCSQLVIEALFLNWRHMDPAVIHDLVQSKLIKSLEECTLPLSSISPLMDICVQYNEEAFAEVAKRIVAKCEDYMKKHIGPDCPPVVEREDVLAQHIMTLGDACAVCPSKLWIGTLRLLGNLIGGAFVSDEDGKRWEGTVGTTCKAVTVTTIGKFCLQDQLLAKNYVPMFGTLLETDTPTAVKLNTLTVMSDLCVRFTSIVESFLGDICVCLKDPDIRVRKTTLDLMIRLIQEDYVKLKCPYFYYVLHLLQDTEAKIRSATKAFIINTVLTKNPKVMVQEFIQALYFLNEYDTNDGISLTFTKVNINPNEKKAFMLSGDGNTTKRRLLLRFMVEHMTDDHKFKTLNSMCSEIFDGVSEDKILLDNKGVPLVADAIFILGCDELRMNSTRNKQEEEDDEGGIDKVDAVVQMAVDVLLKRLYQENVMPSIIKFKRKLQEIKSSLVRDLMVSIRAMMKEFKDWMQEILSADPTLQSEIELDLRILNQEEEAEPSQELPPTPRVMNDSDKLPDLRQPMVSVTRLSAAVLMENGIRLSPKSVPSPRRVASPRGSISSRLSPREPVPSPTAPISDDDLSSLSTPSTSSSSRPSPPRRTSSRSSTSRPSPPRRTPSRSSSSRPSSPRRTPSRSSTSRPSPPRRTPSRSSTSRPSPPPRAPSTSSTSKPSPPRRTPSTKKKTLKRPPSQSSLSSTSDSTPPSTPKTNGRQKTVGDSDVRVKKTKRGGRKRAKKS